MSVKISNKSKPKNDVNEAGASNEGLSSSRFPFSEQKGPGHHRITANRRASRGKWSQEQNRVVVQCYYISEYVRNGY